MLIRTAHNHRTTTQKQHAFVARAKSFRTHTHTRTHPHTPTHTHIHPPTHTNTHTHTHPHCDHCGLQLGQVPPVGRGRCPEPLPQLDEKLHQLKVVEEVPYGLGQQGREDVLERPVQVQVLLFCSRGVSVSCGRDIISTFSEGVR